VRRWLRRFLLAIALVFVALPAGLIALYRVVPPPVTPLMVIRLFEGYGIEKDWTSLDQMAAVVPRSVIAAEDNRFCRHFGFDVQAIREQVERYADGLVVRGASGITQQTAKNLFLWPGQDWLRKGLETYLALGLEIAWPKRRILEVYLNVAEFGPGIYGVESAARANFGKPAARLTGREAALLASILPAPLHRSAAKPSAAVLHKADVVRRRVDQISNLLDCV
jgi:monofunctional glycosyltransferase